MTEPTVQETEAESASPEAQQDNANALYALLDTFEAASAGVQRDKGTRFEMLIKDWLTKEPTYKDLFKEVVTYSEFARRFPDFVPNAIDTGIDLVGINADDGRFTAIQCKFYGKKSHVPKAGIDSFISASGLADLSTGEMLFTRRFIVATNETWSTNIRGFLTRITPPHHTDHLQ